MHIKIINVLILCLTLISCSVSEQNNIDKIISNFEQENVQDKRETIFDISFQLNNGLIIFSGETDNAELKKKLLSELTNYKIEDKIIVLPDSSVGMKPFGLINLSVANLRTKPSHSEELATQALLGTPVKILKNRDGWFIIQTPDKYISWVDKDGIFPISEKELQKWKDSKRILFTGDNATIYETEKLENPVSDITMGNIIEEIDRNQNSIKVRLPDGITGYTPKVNWIDFNEFKKNIQPDSAHIIPLAKSFMRRPYLWGGTSARAMDCSGFVKMVYFMNGIILARDASLQTRHGELIDINAELNNFQPGDLLFFGQQKTMDFQEKVTHVGLSLGGSEYIHASGKIRENSFNPESSNYSAYRKNSFVRARRINFGDDQEGILKINQHPWY